MFNPARAGFFYEQPIIVHNSVEYRRLAMKKALEGGLCRGCNDQDAGLEHTVLLMATTPLALARFQIVHIHGAIEVTLVGRLARPALWDKHAGQGLTRFFDDRCGDRDELAHDVFLKNGVAWHGG